MRTALLGAATVAALAAGTLATTSVLGSSHREAPRIMLDPSADNTDLYAFTAPDAPGKLTVISNWVPLQNPAGGPYFGKLDPEAHYYVKIDNTGDGVEDVAYRWEFKNEFRIPGSFLYAVPPVNNISDKNLNFVQTYNLYREQLRNGKVVDEDRVAHNVPVAPDNVGPKTTPDYARLSGQAVRGLPGGGKTFVGPADDAFFVDLGSIFDGINIDKPGRPAIGLGNQGGGNDDVSGFNVHSFALQIPQSEVTRDRRMVSGPTAANAVVGIWTTTERKAVKVKRGKAKEHWVQVSRLGNPLINEVDRADRGEGSLQRDVAQGRPEELRRGRARSGAGADPQRALQPGHQGDGSHGHRAGAADRRARPHADREGRGPGRHAEVQPRRAAGRQPEPLRRARQ